MLLQGACSPARSVAVGTQSSLDPPQGFCNVCLNSRQVGAFLYHIAHPRRGTLRRNRCI